jgi:hypothetical protein
MRLLRPMLNLRRRQQIDADIRAELDSHIKVAVEDGVRRGKREADAWSEAKLRFWQSGAGTCRCWYMRVLLRQICPCH